MMILWIVLIVAAVLGLAAMVIYNGLVSLRNRVDEAWSDIDVQLKRRYDLIPNLLETVKGYAAHEQATLQKVIEARNAAMTAHDGADLAQQQAAENALSSTLKSIFALSESYPDLKANQNFLDLQRELTDTEDKIQAARRFYNGNVRDFNIKLEAFPSNLIAGLMKLTPRKFFEAAETEKQPVTVKF